MPLKLTCPHCGHPARLTEPYPLPGSRLQCAGCGSGLAVTYPDGVVDQLRSRGRMFQSEDQAATPRAAQRSRPTPKAAAPPPPSAAPKTHVAATKAAPKVDRPTEAPTTVDPTVVATHDPDEYFDRTVPSARTPYGGLPGNANEPEAAMASLQDDDNPTEGSFDEEPIPVVAAPKSKAKKGAVSDTTGTEHSRKAKEIGRAHV